jgi:hypothetical protein
LEGQCYHSALDFVEAGFRALARSVLKRKGISGLLEKISLQNQSGGSAATRQTSSRERMKRSSNSASFANSYRFWNMPSDPNPSVKKRLPDWELAKKLKRKIDAKNFAFRWFWSLLGAYVGPQQLEAAAKALNEGDGEAIQTRNF